MLLDPVLGWRGCSLTGAPVQGIQGYVARANTLSHRYYRHLRSMYWLRGSVARPFRDSDARTRR